MKLFVTNNFLDKSNYLCSESFMCILPMRLALGWLSVVRLATFETLFRQNFASSKIELQNEKFLELFQIYFGFFIPSKIEKNQSQNKNDCSIHYRNCKQSNALYNRLSMCTARSSWATQDKLRSCTRYGVPLAGLHFPKNLFFLAVVLERFFFFADSSKKKGFQPVKSPYFCVGQQKTKKKERLEKNRKKNRYFGTCKPAIYLHSISRSISVNSKIENGSVEE